MIDPGWFVDFTLKSSAIAILALLAARALRGRSAAERSSVLHAGLLAMALLPFLVGVTPRWQVELPAILAPTLAGTPSATLPADVYSSAIEDAAASGGAASRSSQRDIVRNQRSERGAPQSTVGTTTWRVDAGNVWGVLYSVPALALLFALGMSLSSLYALRDRSTPLRDARWDEALRHAQRRSGVRGTVDLLHSPETPSPLSWGLRRRLIVLDADTIEPTAAQALLAHELAHLARHDWLKLIGARIVTALLWFNPLVWMLARRCHQLREEAADDAVLRGDVPGVDYAEVLLHFARSASAQRALAAHAIFSGRGAMQHLTQRLARVLDDGERRGPAMRAWSFGCAVAALTLAISLAAFTPMVAPAYAGSDPRVTPAAAAPLRTAIAVAAGATAASTASTSDDDLPLTFTIGPRRGAAAGTVQVTFEQRSARGRNMHSRGLPLAQMQGLTEATLAAEQPKAVDFRIVRAAGTLHCEGSARRGVASGTCGYAPDAAFAAELERRGVGRISTREQLQLTLQDARLDLLDELVRQGYETPDARRYLEMAIHEVDVAWLRGLQGAGLKLDSLARLVEFRIHDIDADYVSELKAAGYGDLAPAQLVEFRIHDIDAAYVGALRAAGYGDLAPRQLVEFRIHDVTGEAIAELAAAGFVDLPAKQLVAMRIHDVTPSFAREMKAAGYGDVGIEQLVQFRIHEVTPAFVREMAAAGHRDLPASRLVQFRIHDVTPAFIREVGELGYRNLDPDQLVAMRVHDITPSYIRAQLADAGRTPPTIEQLVGRRIHGE